MRESVLESHLEKFQDERSKLMWANWLSNKEKLTSALQLITTSFPTYSLHDSSHSETIIENIERLLGDKIEKLGATDTYMLLMAAYTHDIGMYLSYKTIEDEWSNEDFADKLMGFEKVPDPQLSRAAKYLREVKEKIAQDSGTNSMKWAVEVRNAVTVLTSELFRSGHAKRSQDYLSRDSEFGKLIGNINIDSYGGMRMTLAKIAYLHYEDINRIFILKQIAKGYTGAKDVCHPRFVACMLRLGDILDYDNNRFNNFALAMVKEVPETSRVHYEKHCSTGNEMSNIAPDNISVTFDCDKDDVYREAARWKRMVENELSEMRSNWSEIEPKEKNSTGEVSLFQLPNASQVNIVLRFQGKENINPDLMHLRFDISSKKTFEMLKGGAIYKNPGRAFLREIVQNAMDATKLQIWKDLREGRHLPQVLSNPNRIINTADDIKFSDDIPTEVYDEYPVKLKIEYDKINEQIRVICEDWGTGISEDSLIRMTSKVGESRKSDKDYTEIVKGMPYFLKPTAAFGLGLQTIFYVADEFTIDTHYPGEPTRKVIFRTSSNGNYCSIEKENFLFTRKDENTNRNIEVKHGSTVIIEIDKAHCCKLFELTDEHELGSEEIEGVFEFYFPEKIDQYIQDTFKKTENIYFSYNSPFLKYMSNQSKYKYKCIKAEEYFRVFYENFASGFRIEERNYGSILTVKYCSLRSWGNTTIQFRDIPLDAEINFPGKGLIDIKWNIFCRQADSFVTISRDRLLPQGVVWCQNKIKELLSEANRLTHEQFINEKNKYTDGIEMEEAQAKYCNLCLIDRLMPRPMINDYSILDKLMIPRNWAIDNHGAAIPATRLLTATKIQVYSGSYVESWEGLALPEEDSIICWNNVDIIPNNYVCYKILNRKGSGSGSGLSWSVYYLRKCLDGIPQCVEYDYDLHRRLLSHKDLMYGIDHYRTIVVNDKAPLLGYSKPKYANCWIYPPNQMFFSIAMTCKEEDKFFSLLKSNIEELVPIHIVKLIQKYNIECAKLTSKSIYNEYIGFLRVLWRRYIIKSLDSIND